MEHLDLALYQGNSFAQQTPVVSNHQIKYSFKKQHYKLAFYLINDVIHM